MLLQNHYCLSADDTIDETDSICEESPTLNMLASGGESHAQESVEILPVEQH